MIRPCPMCVADDHRTKMRVEVSWNRKDGVVGRRLRCPNCNLLLRSYEFIGTKKLGHNPGYSAEQMSLL